MSVGGVGGGMSGRAASLLDAVRERMLALAAAHPDPLIRDHTARAAARLVWAGSWLDVPYAPTALRSEAPPPVTAIAARELHQAADQFDELLEDLEGDDPVANANGVQASCLAFAIVGATAAYLDRAHAAAEGHAAR